MVETGWCLFSCVTVVCPVRLDSVHHRRFACKLTTHGHAHALVWQATRQPLVLVGPNVVVKGPPYLPSVGGNTVCNDVVNDACSVLGNCTSCTTFNQVSMHVGAAAHINRYWTSCTCNLPFRAARIESAPLARPIAWIVLQIGGVRR
jgi:hypothetical protein